MRSQTRSLLGRLIGFCAPLTVLLSLPLVFAQSSQVDIEWELFNQILIIGIAVGIVVFGLLFYAIVRFREKPGTAGVS